MTEAMLDAHRKLCMQKMSAPKLSRTKTLGGRSFLQPSAAGSNASEASRSPQRSPQARRYYGQRSFQVRKIGIVYSQASYIDR